MYSLSSIGRRRRAAAKLVDALPEPAATRSRKGVHTP
jgi:hypothetical protein